MPTKATDDRFELDHIFIWTTTGAPEAERLIAFGLTEGAPNVHPGQGTANRRFFFHNAMLELVWVCDPAEIQSESIRRTQLWERWSGRAQGASPFSICLRPARPDVEGLPFPAWEYRPPYLPAPWSIHVGEGVPLAEPMWFYLGFVGRGGAARGRPQPVQHPVGLREVTRLRVTGPWVDQPSPVAEAVRRTGAVTFEPGPEHLLEVRFDQEAAGRRTDFRPVLPLVFSW
jgi:hypothetical protein